jgi:acetyl esterase/lipase
VAPRDVQAYLAELTDWASTNGGPSQTYRYDDGPEHEADLMLPAGDGPYRVAVLLHGGFWRARFTRAIMSALAVDLAARGWASWNVEYRRLGRGGGAPEMLDDVRAALDALIGAEIPLDPSRAVVIGHSAEASLVSASPGRPGRRA